MSSQLEILQTYGETVDLYEFSLSNAIRLADGALSMVVVMQEPCNLADEVAYDTMVYGDQSSTEWSQRRIGCPALQEVESLIEEASNGRYGLDDVSLFDLNTLLSPVLQQRLEDSGDLQAELSAAHRTFWRMILAKRPKVIVILTCAAGKSENKAVRLFWSSIKAAGTKQQIMLRNRTHNHEAMIVRGFHPSMYLRDDYIAGISWSHERTRAAKNMLRLCFIQALSTLTGEGVKDSWERDVTGSWKAYVNEDIDTNDIADLLSKKLSIG